jgi:hypothetical protein
MAGAFQTDNYWLLLDDGHADVDWEDGPGTDEEFDRRLAGSGRLPDLAGAPVASWVAARLARLAGGLPGRACHQHVDGGEYLLNFLVFRPDRSHIGSAQIQADRSGVAICCVCPGARRVLAELAASLLAESADVAECRIDVSDPETDCGHAYGYEWGQYLGGSPVAP